MSTTTRVGTNPFVTPAVQTFAITVHPDDLARARAMVKDAGATIVLSSPVPEGYRMVIAEAAPEAVVESPAPMSDEDLMGTCSMAMGCGWPAMSAEDVAHKGICPPAGHTCEDCGASGPSYTETVHRFWC